MQTIEHSIEDVIGLAIEKVIGQVIAIAYNVTLACKCKRYYERESQ